MTPFECFKAYSALKLHFTSDYNYFLYNGNIKLKPETFERRNDKIFFAKVAKHSDPLHFLMINILDNPKMWIKNLAYSEEANARYNQWLKTKQSLSYVFTEDLKKFNSNFDSNIVIKDNSHPLVLTQYFGKEITLETVSIIYSLVCSSYWDTKMKDDPVWEDLSFKIRKYLPFLNLDVEKYRKIILSMFKE